MPATKPDQADVGKSCPSAPLAAGNTIIGVLGRDGRVHNFRTTMIADAGFVAAAGRKGPAEAHVRSAGHCVEGACAQWTGKGCGVIERVLEHLGAAQVPAVASLQPCVIRASCRWFSQRGAAACHGCQYVITDSRELAEVDA